MAAITSRTAFEPANASSGLFSGLLLTAGAASLFVGTLFYARLTPALGLPARASERGQALADVLALGPDRLGLAGGFAFAGDCLLLAACIALAFRARRRASDLDLAGWALIAVSVAIATVFDSMTAALFWPLARSSDPAPFLAVKAWFDFLFAAGNAPFGLGFIAILAADRLGSAPLLPKAVAVLGMAIGAAAAISGLGYLVGLIHLPLVIGLTVTFGCLILAALGVRILQGASAT